MGDKLRSSVGEHPKKGDCVLAQVMFSCNDYPNRSIGLSPFHILYGMNPRVVCELRGLGKLEQRSADG